MLRSRGDQIGVGLAVVLVSVLIWYSFIYAPPDPFAYSLSGDLLADPQDPPDAQGRRPALERKKQEESVPVEVKRTQPACPPDDAMCGDL